MAIITEVRFAHEDGALADTLSSRPELVVSTVRETSTAPGQGVYFFRFDNIEPDEIASTLEPDHTVRTARPVSAVDDRHLWGIEFTPETKLLAPEVTKEGGFVLGARSSLTRQVPRGWRERWFFPDQEGVLDVWQHARAEEFEFEVLDLSQQLRSDASHVDSDPVTDQQRTALLTAYERGYFREPREASLEDLAESLGISPSAVNGRLKRGLKSLIGETLVVETPGDDGSRLRDEDIPETRAREDTIAARSGSGERNG